MLAVEARTRVGPIALDVALAIEPGRCLALVGPSGAGKTSVLRTVAGLLRPDAGRVRCGDELWLDTTTGVDLPPERRRVGYLFQEHALFPHLEAWENVAYPLRGPSRGARRARAHELLARFGLEDRAAARPRELSGGERQRVALARALAREPAALLLDEPLAALDVRTRAAATRTLAGLLRDAGVPALLVTHDFTEAATLGDEVGVLDAGRVVQRGTASALAAAPATAFVADLTGAVVLTGVARPGPGGLTLVALDGGGTVTSTDPGEGPVAVSVLPWDVVLEAPEATPGSARNRLPARVQTLTTVGNRVRVGLDAPQPLAAEVTTDAVSTLGLAPGTEVRAVFKATATRLVAK